MILSSEQEKIRIEKTVAYIKVTSNLFVRRLRRQRNTSGCSARNSTQIRNGYLSDPGARGRVVVKALCC
jgi:hypothetical protein